MKPRFRRVRFNDLPVAVIGYIESTRMQSRSRGWAQVVVMGVMYVANRRDQWFRAQT